MAAFYAPDSIRIGKFLKNSFQSAQLIAIDELFRPYFTNPIRIHFKVFPRTTNKPRIIHNTGLTIIEGGQKLITPFELGISDTDSQDDLKFSVLGGNVIKGSLSSGKMSKSHWRWKDIVDGKVEYLHDGSDKNFDVIGVQVDDYGKFGARHVLRFTVPVHVLPVDDGVPLLTHNLNLDVEVFEHGENGENGQNYRFGHFNLHATDSDSSSKDIFYEIEQRPSSGNLKIENAKHSIINPSKFTQFDIDSGFLFYQHNKNFKSLDEDFDSFTFKLSDRVGNESPLKTHTIFIKTSKTVEKSLCTSEKDFVLNSIEGTVILFDEQYLNCSQTDTIKIVPSSCFGFNKNNWEMSEFYHKKVNFYTPDRHQIKLNKNLKNLRIEKFKSSPPVFSYSAFKNLGPAPDLFGQTSPKGEPARQFLKFRFSGRKLF